MNGFCGADSSVGEKESANQTEESVGHGHRAVHGQVVVDVDSRVLGRVVAGIVAVWDPVCKPKAKFESFSLKFVVFN